MWLQTVTHTTWVLCGLSMDYNLEIHGAIVYWLDINTFLVNSVLSRSKCNSNLHFVS